MLVLTVTDTRSCLSTKAPTRVFTDDDQQWQPHAISTLLAQAQTHPESAWSYYTYRYWTQSRTPENSFTHREALLT